MSAKRNITVDIVRGLAMLMVILQHTISGTSTPLQNTFFFNLIWSIQMPLFFIISGYVTRYSKPIANLTDLWKFIERRTVSYLFPWIIWTFVIRGFVCQETIFYDLKFLFWHMDTGYWFLVSLWTIVILYGCVDYIASKISKNLVFSAITHCLFMVVAAVPLIVIGLYWGINFLSIKLTLYYIPLYLCGYLFGQIQLKYDMSQKLRTIQVVASFAVGLWIYIITRLDFYGQEVSITILFARYLAAIAGCCVIIYWASGLLSGNHPVDSDDNDYKKSPFLMKNTFLSENLKSQLFCILKQSGFNSISLYLIHGFFLNIIPIDRFYNVELIAIPLCFINYLICVTLTLSLIKFLKKFPHLNYLLFWNRTI